MDKEEVNPDVGLYNTGEYYLKNKRFTQAKYVFGRYLTYYPSGRNAAQAAKNLEAAETALARYGDGKGPGVNPSAAAPVSAARPAAPDFTPAAPAASAPAELPGTAKAYYDAVSMISQEKYSQAYLAFKKIADAGEDEEWTARSSYEIGRCLFLLNKFEDCIRHYTALLTKYPKHPDLKDAMFFMGQSYEKAGKKEQAAAFYKKILSMSNDEDDGTNIKAKRALKALEG
jgi:TolA-binding protein